jgi:probable rRNA maturation factor
MSYQAYLHCEPRYKHMSAGLAAAASAALSYGQAAPGEVTVVLTDNQRIREFNRRFAGRDALTDVLSFADGSQDTSTGNTYFGDVVISIPVAKVQAEKAGHSLEVELTLLSVHGVLHLLGYDHAHPEDREQMWNAQSSILGSLGYEITLPQEKV